MKMSRHVRCFLGIGSFLILASCSGQGIRDGFGLVEGKITYQNNPVTGGSIHFFQGQEKVGSCMIRGDGTYSAEIPLGPVKAAIETVSVKYKDQEGRKAVLQVMKENGFDVDADQREPKSPAYTAAKGTYVDIPERYGDPENSGLEHKVVRGRQTCDFNLK